MLIGRVHQQEKKTWIPQKLLKQQVYVLDAFFSIFVVCFEVCIKNTVFDDALYTVIPIC